MADGKPYVLLVSPSRGVSESKAFHRILRITLSIFSIMRFRYADFSAMGVFFIEYPKLFRSMEGSLLVGKLGDESALLQAKQEQVLPRYGCQPFALRIVSCVSLRSV